MIMYNKYIRYYSSVQLEGRRKYKFSQDCSFSKQDSNQINPRHKLRSLLLHASALDNDDDDDDEDVHHHEILKQQFI
jgi:hypothetical protein